MWPETASRSLSASRTRLTSSRRIGLWSNSVVLNRPCLWVHFDPGSPLQGDSRPSAPGSHQFWTPLSLVCEGCKPHFYRLDTNRSVHYSQSLAQPTDGGPSTPQIGEGLGAASAPRGEAHRRVAEGGRRAASDRLTTKDLSEFRSSARRRPLAASNSVGCMEAYYLVITVKDPGDREAGISPCERRFQFDDPEEALECAHGAHRAGFEVSAATVSATRTRTPAASVWS